LGKIIRFAVMIFNPKWRLSMSERLGKALAEITIEIEG
jgi:hypothetical protein